MIFNFLRMAHTQMVFISYSRKDYYFAESLASCLLQNGVQVWLDSKDLQPSADWSEVIESAIDAATSLILVVSPESLKSPIVRREWQRARSQGKRIVAVLFRKKTIPSEVGSVEVIDFRGSFESALKQLVYNLASTPCNTSLMVNSHRLGLPFRLPPMVAIISLLLAWVFLSAFLSPDFYKEGLITIRSNVITHGIVGGVRWDPTVLTVLIKTLMILIVVLCVRFGFIDFIRRRMGMTRLALLFAFGVYLSGSPWLQELLGAQWVPGAFMRLLRNNWPASGIVFFAVFAASLTGLWIVLFKRPGDLLRWAPTGRAWECYRLKHAPQAVVAEDAAFSIKKLKSFKLSYDARDASLAEQVRRKLRLAGATDTLNDSEDVTTILLLTNCTRLDWIEKQVQCLKGRLFTFLGTNVGVTNSLEWLWRIHWVDFRNLDTGRVANQRSGLPLVPEALTQPRFPPVVALAHHLLRALGALLFNFFYTVAPQGAEQMGTPSKSLAVMGLFTLFVPFLWVIPAGRLVKRSCSTISFYSAVAVCFLVTLWLAFWKVHHIPMWEINKAYVAGIVLIGVFVWVLWQARKLASWFPLSEKGWEKGTATLAPTRNRLTLIWFAIYGYVWAQVFGQIHLASF